MKQSAADRIILWSALVIVVAVIFGAERSNSPQSDDPGAHQDMSAASSPHYPGPSHDYAATPSPSSLTYSGPASAVVAPGPRRQRAGTAAEGDDALKVACRELPGRTSLE